MLDEICRRGTQRMLAVALEAEADRYIEAFADERDAHGRHLVARNGHVEPRTITTAAGASRSRLSGSTTGEWTQHGVDATHR